MGLLGQCGRTVFNLLPLRGRKRRLAKLLVILLVSAIVFVFGIGGACTLDSRLCAEEGQDDSLERSRDRFEVYEVKDLGRNIKGDHNGLKFVGDSNLEKPHQADNQLGVNKEENQIQPPPPGGDGDVMDEGRQEKGGAKDSADPNIDILTTAKPKSHNQPLVFDKNQHGNDATADAPSQRMEDATDESALPEATKVSDGRAGEKLGEVVAQQPGHDTEQVVGGVEVGEGGQVSRKKKEVGVIKTKTDAASEVIPGVGADSIAPIPKLKVEDTILDAGVQDLSLPPGVVAKPKKRVIVNDGGGQAGGTAEKGGGNTERDSNGGGGVEAVQMDAVAVSEGRGGGGGGGRGVQAVQAVPMDAVAVNGGMGGGGGGGGSDGQISAAEMAKAIESGEMCKTVCPPFAWSDWSPCSKACGRGRRYRKALYKFICQSSELCPLNRIEESVCETPCKFDPEKYGGPGGLDMYPINPLNPAMYPEDKRYMCGHWLVEYEKLHQDILAGKRPPRYLVYSTGKGTYPNAGGIAPRLRGITTSFFLAVLLDRAFMIEWLDPPGLDLYLEPKSFNWADLSKLEKLNRGPVRDIGSWRSAKESGISSQWYMSTNFSTYFSNDVEVVQGHRYDFTYAVLRNPELMPKAFELGVDRIKCRICCAFHMLFKMTEKFQQEMDKLLTSLGAPQKTIGAIQVRTKSHNVQEAAKYIDAFVKCATKAGKSLKISSRIAWVPIFNNRLLVHIVHKKYGDKLKIPINIDTATRTVHTHLGNLPADTEVEVAKAVQERTFKEFFLTINSTIIIRKKGYEGSFGNVADAIRRFYHELGSVHTFLVGNTCTKFPDTFKIE